MCVDLSQIENGISELQKDHLCNDIKNELVFDSSLNTIDNFNDLLNKIIKETTALYLNHYSTKIGYDILKAECVMIINFILYILLSTQLFEIKNNKIQYENSTFDKKRKKGLLEAIKYLLEGSYLYTTLCIYNEYTYITIIYNSIVNLINEGTYFNGVSILDKNNKKIDFRRLSSEEKYLLRMQILNYYKSHPQALMDDMAKLFNVEIRNIYFVVKKYNENPCVDFRDFNDKKRGPAESFFNVVPAKIFAELVETIVTKMPSDFNIDYATWSGDAVVQFLKEKFNLEVKRSYIYYLFRRFEINSKFGKRINPNCDISEMLEFVRVKYRAICEEAKKRGEVVIFGDETSCIKDYHLRGFSPKGSRAVVMHTTNTKHTGYSLFNIIGPDGFFKMFLIEGTFDAIIFKSCLKRLHEEFPDKKFVLILDNSRVHHAKLVKQWIDKLEKKFQDFIRFEWLPAYCPELNPVEFLNNEFKGYLRKKGSISKEDVVKLSKEYISMYVDGDENEMRQRIINFFKTKECLYSYLVYIDVFKN